MSEATVVFSRHGRLIAVTDTTGGPPEAEAVSWLKEALTYFERHYDFEAYGESGNKFSSIERRLYSIDARTGALTFPLGLRPRMAAGLKAIGISTRYVSQSLLNERPDVYALDWDGLFADFAIYHGQDQCLSAISAADGGIVSATTGMGKSVMMQMLCRWYHKARIHVTTKSVSLADQIWSGLQKYIPNVGFVGGGKRFTGRVTVYVADSLHHGQGDADLVLGDEAHELISPKYAGLLGQYRNARMFGFSATPTGRMDGRDLEAEAIFGPIIYTISYQDAQMAGRVVPITVEWIRPKGGPNLHGVSNPSRRDQVGIWTNLQRNQLIAERARACAPDEQVMIIVKTIEHAARLKQLLPEYTMCYAANGMDPERLNRYIRAGVLPQDEPLMTRDRLKDLREQFAAGTLKKVISNYVWSTGVDFRHLGVMIRADAAASEIRDGQIPGRVCRRVPGSKETAILVDVWDDWDVGYLSKSRSRRRNYEKRGWTQITATP